ncbi:MAG TPA: SMI1/KNR4 family protein [Polyangiaceae bacterium]|nr:SMI1/KNR4 family protein [Polyangiaceae bacterium]
MMDRDARIRDAIERVKTWMQAHGAGALVENLAPGHTRERLDHFEAAVGFPLPADLRALWSVHAGQRSEQNGFVGAMDLFGPDASLGEEDAVSSALKFLRRAPAQWAEAGVTREEAKSNAWLAIAGRGYADLLVVNGETGRVFTCEKISPPLHLVAESILDWLEAYAERVEAGQYAVKEGFGDCYLVRPDAMY